MIRKLDPVDLPLAEPASQRTPRGVILCLASHRLFERQHAHTVIAGESFDVWHDLRRPQGFDQTVIGNEQDAG